jgi:hypothetical protein
MVFLQEGTTAHYSTQAEVIAEKDQYKRSKCRLLGMALNGEVGYLVRTIVEPTCYNSFAPPIPGSLLLSIFCTQGL